MEGMQRRIWGSVLAVLCALVAGVACGDREPPGPTGPVTYGDPDAPPTTVPTADPGDVAAAAPTTAAGREGAQPGSPTTIARRPGTGSADGGPPTSTSSSGGRSLGTGGEDGPPPTVTADPGADGSLGPPGAFARTILRPRPATVVVVECFHQRGAEPQRSSIDFATATLRNVTGKTVDVRDSLPLAGSGEDWTADEIRALADRSSRVTQGGAYAVLRVLFLGGTFEGSDSILGVAVRGDTLALFSDSIDGATTPVLSGAAIEEAVLVHELGHLLGLVDLARNTGRADPEHPGHSRNPASVMYWAVESDLIGQVLTGPPPREFDEADLADLRALRDGAE
jgi:hypothetical protein